MSNKKQHGFTLIELMIVIGIIGILSGIIVGIINVPELRKKAEDTEVISDVEKVKSILELYFSDNVRYPNSLADLSGYIDPVPAIPNHTYVLRNEIIPPGGIYGGFCLVADLAQSINANGECCGVTGYTNCYGVTNP